MSSNASLVGRIAAAWRDPAAAMRAELAGPKREGRGLFYAYLACGLLFLARLPDAPEAAVRLGADGAGNILPIWLFTYLLLGPLLLYGIGTVSHLGARLFGGAGEGSGARLALFWALLVAMPVVLIAEAVGAVLPGSPVSQAVALGSGAVTLWFWARSLGVAEGFEGGRGLARAVASALFPVILFAGLGFAILAVSS